MNASDGGPLQKQAMAQYAVRVAEADPEIAETWAGRAGIELPGREGVNIER